MLNLGEGSAYPRASASQQRFFRIARASAIEVEGALECAMALGFCDAATFDARPRAGCAARLATSVSLVAAVISKSASLQVCKSVSLESEDRTTADFRTFGLSDFRTNGPRVLNAFCR